MFGAVEYGVVGRVEAGEQLAVFIKDRHLGDFFGLADLLQGFLYGHAVVEHHGGFQGVGQRTGNQLQVVAGIGTQRQQADQGQRQAGQAHGQQGHAQVGVMQEAAQAWALLGSLWLSAVHGCGPARLPSCSTLG